MIHKSEIDKVLDGVFHDKYQLINDHRQPKYVVVSKPVETALKLIARKNTLKSIGKEIEQQNELLGLKIIVFDRDDIFYLVG